MEKEETQKNNELKTEAVQPNFLGRGERSKDVLRELRELEEKKERQQIPQVKKDIFLIITRDTSIFNPALPAGKLVADISSVVPELHIIFIGRKQEILQKKENTFLYTAIDIPLLSFFTVYKVILSQLVWKRHFRPTVIVSIGDEIRIAKRFSRKYGKPLYVFYSYMKVLGKGKISMHALIKATTEKIIVPNPYIEQAIKRNRGYKSTESEIKILPEYMDIPELEHLLDGDNITGEVESRKKIYSMIIFPHRANLDCFLKIRKISKDISSSIRNFQFNVVVKRGQFLQAKIWSSLFSLPVVVSKEGKESIGLFRTSRLMLYFDSPKVPYEPIFYSFVSGCPVLSSGDEYSKVILFDSEFKDLVELERSGKSFGKAIKKLINDPYLYSKYKINCIGFSKTAFTHDHDAYMVELRDILNTHT